LYVKAKKNLVGKEGKLLWEKENTNKGRWEPNARGRHPCVMCWSSRREGAEGKTKGKGG